MTARGTYNQEGENVYLWKNTDDTYEYVPDVGGTGGLGVSMKKFGQAGGTGIGRATGGGGAGGSTGTNALRGGHGGRGTSYSGGAGGGGVYHTSKAGVAAGDGSNIGGAGGYGSARANSTGSRTYASGGAGNKAGEGAYSASAGNTTKNAPSQAENGTGGLLIIYADTLYNNGEITSKGSNVKGKQYSSANRVGGGGASGGGSINIFANYAKQVGEIGAKGGTTSMSSSGLSYYSLGGAGGEGTVTINELGSVLNYPKKKITLKVNETYSVDKTQISYTKLNEIQTEDINVGQIGFDTLENNIAEVTEEGQITAKNIGTTKIKITDKDNKHSTYIVVEVIKDIAESQIKIGTNFTLALKEDGTVWEYGKDIANEPKQVMLKGEGIKDIIQIGAGNTNKIALNNLGEVYIWGTYTLGANVTTSKEPIKLEGLSNIIAVDCKGDNFYVLDNIGNAYIFGKGYSTYTRIDTDLKIADIGGTLLLGENGKVYDVSNPKEEIKYLNGIYKVASGEDHNMFLTLDGYVYTIGKGALGQLGNGKTKDLTVPTLSSKIDGYLENMIDISAGNKTSMAVSLEGNAYAWGENSNNKIGIEPVKISYATQITKLQDKEGNEIPLRKIENIETGITHSSISDQYGYVYSVGLNKNGELGTEDNIARAIFTRIGNIEVVSNPEGIYIPVGETKEIEIYSGNTFNLKTEKAGEAEVNLDTTNEKEVIVGTIENTSKFRLTGEKIGRTHIIAEDVEGNKKYIWVNIVDQEQSKASSKVVNGKEYTVALKSDGTIWGFGNINGENSPEKIEVLEEIIDISSGISHVLILGKSGTVYTMGTNAKGELGTGNTIAHNVPKAINLKNIAKVIAVGSTSYAVSEDGKVYAWGNGHTKVPSEINVAINFEEKIGEKIDQISLGLDYALVLGKSGKAYIYDRQDAVTPVKTEDGLILENIKEVSAGNGYSVLVTKDNKVYSFGDNDYEKLGVSNANNEGGIQESENAILNEKVENIGRVTAGYNHTSVYDKNGNIYTWGRRREWRIRKYRKLQLFSTTISRKK